MKFVGSSLFAIAACTAFTTGVQAQDNRQSEVLPEAVAEGDKVDDTYTIGTGADSGVSSISRKEIEARTPGSGDVNQLLKVLPTVQFDRNEGIADREAIQDIRPAEISISGGRVYENLISIDGIDVNSRLDTTNDNPFNFNELAGTTPQTIWLDSELIGSITLRDSNVSAEHGRFTGGALEIETREALRSWGASANIFYTEDDLVNFIVSDGTRQAFEESGDPLPEVPEFRKLRFGASLDVPLGDRGGLLIAANRSRADVLYFRSAGYNFEPGYRHSISDNFLVSGNYDLTSDLTVSGQITYSPYESEAANQNGIDNLITSEGGGLAAKLELASSGDLRWNVKGTFSHSDSSRTAPFANYSIPSTTTNGAVCSNRNCTIGGFGDLDQTQDTFGLTGSFAKDMGPGEFSAGFDFQHIDAVKERPESNRAYSRARTGDNIVCTTGDNLTCATGEYYLTTYFEYRAYRADVSLDNIGLWAQYDASFGPVDLRGGLRYDYESFLGNHDFAPRLSATYNFNDDWALTAGANRYYGRSLLAYAIRESYPNLFRYTRNATTVGSEQQVGEDDWALNRETVLTGYRNADLDTPYSDELTAAATGKVLGGTARLKGIFRWGRDEFSRSELQRIEIDNGDGTTSTRRIFEATNDGRSRYRGGSLEWVRNFGKHSVALNVNYSKTFSDNDDFLTTADDIAELGETVLFQGEIVDLVEIENQNQRLEFASPFIINASWTAKWLNDRLTTNVNARYRDGFTRIEDTGANETVDGTRFDVYDFITYPDRINFDLNAQFDVVDQPWGKFTMDMRGNNVLDTIPARNSVQISQPYQYGRSFWFGLKYKY